MEKGTKRRRSASEMELLVRKWEQSGQSRADFCREEGLPAWVFQYWLSRYREKRSSELAVGFSEIVVKGEDLGNGLITIRHPDGLEVQIRNNVSAFWLRQLLGW